MFHEQSILDNQQFASAYAQLKQVSLNPRRHAMPDAHIHSEAVAAMARRLGVANQCPEPELQLLSNLGHAHDIGKINGNARPSESLVVLADCGITDPTFLALVKWHDTALPWFKALSSGQPASKKGWTRLAAEVDLRLLTLFMVADRVDAPRGWRGNGPTTWFLGEARKRHLIPDLIFDLPDHPSVIQAAALATAGDQMLLLGSSDGWHLPTDQGLWDELYGETAIRALAEQTGLATAAAEPTVLGQDDLMEVDASPPHLVRTVILRIPVAPAQDASCGAWISATELEQLPLREESLRPHLLGAL
jgi:ADP-ribose pyrophosphatase YjhB (NUDIX family)